MQLSMVSRLKNDHFTQLIGYCLESNNRILAYQYAAMGSLHDVLHGTTRFHFSINFKYQTSGSLLLIILEQGGRVYKGLNPVLFLVGAKELKLLMVQQEALSFYMKRFSLQLFIVMSDPATSFCLMILLPRLLISV